jgi:uncharacterized LabA/DUF88 family protein
MGLNRIAILIDGGFFKQRFKKNSKRDATKKDVEDLISDIMLNVAKKNAYSAHHPDVLIRTFYYDCHPYGKEVLNHDGKTKVDFSKNKLFTKQTAFLHSLDTIEQFALRLGELSFSGWKMHPDRPTKITPDFRQKGVDMKIGLDIAWMAGKKTVDKIVLVTGDSDFIAPMKLARREGIQIYLAPMKNNLKHELIRHADFIIS